MRNLYLLKFLIEFVFGIFWAANVSSLIKSGHTLAEAALLMAFFYFAIAFFEVPTGLVADKYGRKRSTVLGLAFVALGFFVSFLNLSNFTLGLGIAITGFGFTMISGASTAWALNVARDIEPSVNTETFFLRYDLFGRLAIIVGGFAGAGVLMMSPHFLWALMGGSAVLALTVAISCSKGSTDLENVPQAGGLIAAFRSIEKRHLLPFLLILLSTLAFGLDHGIRNTIFQPFLMRLKGDAVIYLAYWQGGLAVSRLLGLLFFKRFLTGLGKSVPLALLAIFLFSLAELSAASATNFRFIFVVFLLAVFCLGWYFPIRDAYFSDLIPEKSRATLMSVDSFVFQIAAGFTCLWFSFSVSERDFQSFWLWGSLFIAASGLLWFLSYVCSKISVKSGVSLISK